MADIFRRLDLAKFILILALIIGIVMRVDAYQHGEGKHVLRFSKDSAMYNAIANNILAGKGYVGKDHMIARKGQPTAFYGPTYPFYLIFIYKVFGNSLAIVQMSHIILEFITAYLLYILGIKLYGRTQGAIAAFIYATSPQIIHYGFKIMTEIIYLFLEILLLLLITAIFQKERPSKCMLISSGLVLGVTYLCRQTIFVLPMIFLPILWLRFYKKNGYMWVLKSTAVFVVGAALVVAPWVVRNYLTFGELMLGTTTGPATLWWGTVEDKGTPLSVLEKRYRNEHPRMSEIQMAHRMSKEANYRLLHMTRAEIIERLIHRPRRLFGFPAKIIDFKYNAAQTMTGIAYALLGLTGLIGLFVASRGKYERLLIGLFAVAAMGLHLVTHTVFRYLMPEVPLLALGMANFIAVVVAAVKSAARPRSGYLTAP